MPVRLMSASFGVTDRLFEESAGRSPSGALPLKVDETAVAEEVPVAADLVWPADALVGT
jgi:hypothetical protein